MPRSSLAPTTSPTAVPPPRSTSSAAAAPRLERLPSVIERTGRGRTAIYDAIRAGTFPAPVKLGPRAVAWRSDEVDEWIQTRPRARQEAAS